MKPQYLNPENLKHRSDVVIWNGVAYVAGVMPTNAALDVKAQAREVFAVIDERLKSAGTDRSMLLSATVWMADIRRDVKAFNEAWNEWVGPGSLPVRACIQSALQLDGLMEVSVIAAVAP